MLHQPSSKESTLSGSVLVLYRVDVFSQIDNSAWSLPVSHCVTLEASVSLHFSCLKNLSC